MPSSIAFLLGLIIGAAAVALLKRHSAEPAAKLPPLGIPAGHVKQFKGDAGGCWWCGDYQCIEAPADSRFIVGDTQRICGPSTNPRWARSCPSTTTLGDGSSWQFKGNCDCDG